MKKSSIQCPSCLHHVFEGTSICRCGKLVRRDEPDQRSLRNPEGTVFAAHLCLSQEVTDAVRTRGGNITTRLETHCGVLQKVRTFTSIWDRWQHDEIYRKSQLSHNWSDAWVRFLDHIAQFDTSHNAPQWQRETDM